MTELPLGQCLETFFCVCSEREWEIMLLTSSEQRLGRLPTINNYVSQKDNGGKVNLGLS